MPNFFNQSLGRYHILEQLGEGGMAIVYKAYDTRLETDVAVKVIRTENILPSVLERSLKRFEREAKALARLTHPNIVKVTDFGEHEGRPYLVMEYLPGGTLKQRLGKPIPWTEAIPILLPIARALDFAHRQNMIHRDVKPSNILITADGEPMLTDFGIAKILDDDATQDLTGTSAAVGTPEYMAPEQAIAKTVDHRADIYSLGVVLYEMLTGRKPFMADTPMAVLIKQATDPLPRPIQFAPNLPEAVEKLLLKTLAKNPSDRYHGMAELAAAWQGMMEAKGQASIPVARAEARKKQPVTATIEETLATVDTESLETVDQSMQEEGEVKRPLVVKQKQSGKEEMTITLAPGVEMTFMRVLSGKFLMGGPDNVGDDDEHPQHDVYLTEFWMGKTPVTYLQYQTFIKITGHRPPQRLKVNFLPDGIENHPVVNISWQDANDFCVWAGEVSRNKIRLPTEAEWEKAARGTDKRIYPWGNQKPNRDLCNYWKIFFGGTTPVGQFSPQGDSSYGCVDMAGNVWEWVSDWYEKTYYQFMSFENPLGPNSGKYRVARGGSWGVNEYYLYVWTRNCFEPSKRDDFIGFRCACSP